MNSEFIDLGFDKYFYAKGMRSIAGQFTQNNRCGIYILHFENREFYVGLAIDVVNRYAQHRQNHKDIEFVSFKEVAKAKLADIERQTVFSLERLNKPLRNINIVSTIIGDTDLDLIIPKAEQDIWINKELTLEEIETERFEYPVLRAKYEKKYQKLSQHPLKDEIFSYTRAYTLTTIPFPKKTEYSFWSISCLPATNQVNLVRTNIYWQETFVISDYKFDENLPHSEANTGLEILIWVTKSVLEKHNLFSSLKEKFRTLEFFDYNHSSGGQDQQCIGIEGFEFNDFLFTEGVIESCRTFNLRLMRKGGCIWNRYHCFHLADTALNTCDINVE